MTSIAPTQVRAPQLSPWMRAAAVFCLLFVFLTAIKGLSTGFMMLSKEFVHSFFAATENPFVGLMVGVLATTLLQSSSVTTSMIVALVAAPQDPLPIGNAVFMVMGANIGTTITNTIVSLGHIHRRDEFRRAFAAATCHDFFNFMAVIVLLPLELATGLLQHSAAKLTVLLSGLTGGTLPNPLKAAIKVALTPLTEGAKVLSDSPEVQGVALVIASALLVFASLLMLVRTLRGLAASRVERVMGRVLDSSAYAAMLIGVVVTVMVQSSSITTSILVPLAGAGMLTLRQIFPVTLGANLGTTVTALLASLAVEGPSARLGLQIALCHLLFNGVGILMIYSFKPIREVPLRLAVWLADVAVRSRRYAVLYVVTLFYGLPALMVWIWR